MGMVLSGCQSGFCCLCGGCQFCDFIQGLTQVIQQVFRVFQAGGEADEAIGDACGSSFVGRDGFVGHGSGMGDEALDPAEALCQFKEAGGGHEGVGGGFRIILQAEGDDASESFGLLCGDGMAGMGGQAGVVYFIYCGMLFQEGRQGAGAGAMLADTQVQCFDASDQEPAVEGGQDGSAGVLIEFDLVSQFFFFCHDEAGD